MTTNEQTKNEYPVPEYIEQYVEFEENFKKTEVSAEEVGELIMRMTTHYIRYNVKFGEALRKFSEVKAEYQTQLDPQTSKPMSTAKAETLAEATPEAAEYQMTKIHVTNIQEIINSMKSLQRAISNEYANTV